VIHRPIFVTDDRYAVPTLRIVQAASTALAVELAKRVLQESSHHKGVELWEADALVLSLGERMAHASSS